MARSFWKKIVRSVEKARGNSRRLFSLLAGGAVIGLAFPRYAHAVDWGMAVAQIMQWVLSILISIFGLLIKLAFDGIIAVSAYNNFIYSESVKLGWVITRDLVNMIFVVSLLLIAIGTILGLEKYQWTKLLPKLALMILLVNFSRMLAGIMIDAGQVVMLTFVNAMKDTGLGNVTYALHLYDIMSFSSSAPPAGVTGTTLIGSMLLGMVILMIALYLIAIILVMLVYRIVVLWVLIILAPFALIGNVFPWAKKWASEWWKEFVSYVIFGPTVIFFLWLALVVGANSGEELVSTQQLSNKQGIILSENLTVAVTKIGDINNLIGFVATTALLVAGLVVAQNLGTFGGTLAGILLSKLKSKGTGMVSKAIGAPMSLLKKGGMATLNYGSERTHGYLDPREYYSAWKERREGTKQRRMTSARGRRKEWVATATSLTELKNLTKYGYLRAFGGDKKKLYKDYADYKKQTKEAKDETVTGGSQGVLQRGGAAIGEIAKAVAIMQGMVDEYAGNKKKQDKLGVDISGFQNKINVLEGNISDFQDEINVLEGEIDSLEIVPESESEVEKKKREGDILKKKGSVRKEKSNIKDEEKKIKEKEEEKKKHSDAKKDQENKKTAAETEQKKLEKEQKKLTEDYESTAGTTMNLAAQGQLSGLYDFRGDITEDAKTPKTALEVQMKNAKEFIDTVNKLKSLEQQRELMKDGDGGVGENETAQMGEKKKLLGMMQELHKEAIYTVNANDEAAILKEKKEKEQSISYKDTDEGRQLAKEIAGLDKAIAYLALKKGAGKKADTAFEDAKAEAKKNPQDKDAKDALETAKNNKTIVDMQLQGLKGAMDDKALNMVLNLEGAEEQRKNLNKFDKYDEEVIKTKDVAYETAKKQRDDTKTKISDYETKRMKVAPTRWGFVAAANRKLVQEQLGTITETNADVLGAEAVGALARDDKIRAEAIMIKLGRDGNLNELVNNFGKWNGMKGQELKDHTFASNTEGVQEFVDNVLVKIYGKKEAYRIGGDLTFEAEKVNQWAMARGYTYGVDSETGKVGIRKNSPYEIAANITAELGKKIPEDWFRSGNRLLWMGEKPDFKGDAMLGSRSPVRSMSTPILYSKAFEAIPSLQARNRINVSTARNLSHPSITPMLEEMYKSGLMPYQGIQNLDILRHIAGEQKVDALAVVEELFRQGGV